MRNLFAGLLVLSAAVVCVGCGGGSRETPVPPADALDTRRCKTTANAQFVAGTLYTDTWAWNVDTVSNSGTGRIVCPFVTGDSSLPLAIVYGGSRQLGSTTGIVCGMGISSDYVQTAKNGYIYPMEGRNFTCRPDPQNPSVSVANALFFLNWKPGYASSNGNYDSLDSITMIWAPYTGGFAQGSIVSPGRWKPGTAGTIRPVYSASVRPEYPEVFVAAAPADTNSYFHQWYVDGTAVSGQVQAKFTYTFPSDAPHTITDRLLRVDGTAFNVTTSFTPVFGGSLSGPTNLDAGQTGFWGYTEPGGRAPLSYSWTLDGSHVSSDPSFGTTFTDAGGHTIGVTVSDAIGRSNWQSLYVTVAPCSFGCTGARVVRPPPATRAGF